MQPGDLVYDVKHSYARGIILNRIDSDLFGGKENIYKVFFAVESKSYFVLESNLRKII